MSGKKRKMSEDPETMRYKNLYENEKMKDKIEEIRESLMSLEQDRKEMFKCQEVTVILKSNTQSSGSYICNAIR